ncbi:hypothetical protein BH10ACI3_BH10ACI3_06800 [soil metagenome]
MHKPPSTNPGPFTAALAGITLLILAVGAGISGQTVGVANAAPASAETNASKKADDPAKTDEPKITFDEKDPTIMYVETNGERFSVNTVTKAITKLTSSAAPAAQQTADTKQTAQPEEKEDFYAYESGEEPYDVRLVNVPTPRKVPKGTWNMSFTHRFSQPIQPISESGKALLGFDSMSASSFGISYGITDKLYVNGYRSPVCQSGLCRVIELGLGYHITDQDKNSPVALSVYASVEGNENFSKQYTYNFQTMISHHFGKRLYVFFSPALHLNSNGNRRFDPKADDYYPPATVADTFKMPVNGASFGMGASFRITPNVMGIFEFTPRTGFKLGHVDPIFDSEFNVTGFNNVSHPEMGIGLQYSVGKHSFTLTLSNTQTTTTSRYNSSNLVLSPKTLILGFNLFRRW